MKAIKWLSEIFNPEDFQDIRVDEIARALGEPDTRTAWISTILDDLKQMNIEIDHRLLSGPDFALSDLCARRRAYQDVLQAILTAQRVKPKEARHNPRLQGVPDLDRVTA